MQNGNPAARLLDVLLEAQDIDRSITTRIAWAQILDTGNNPPLLYERLSKVMTLSEEAYSLVIELFPRQARAAAAWKNALDAAFNAQNLSGQFETFFGKISTTTIDHLTAAADLLDTKTPDKLTTSKISEFISSLNELVEEVLSGDFEGKVKEYLARSIRKIVIALEEYRLGGTIPVTDSIEALLGHSFFDRDYGTALHETDTGSKILNTLGGLADAITVATPLAPYLLSETAKKMLGAS
jgi:Mor family transcriptional regulator